MTITRVRLALIGALGVVLASVGGAAFDDRLPSLVAPALLPPVVVLLAGRLLRVGQWIAAAAAVLVALTIVTVVEEGDAGDLVGGLRSGLRRTLSTDWPSPIRPDLVVFVAFVIATATAVASVLVRLDRFHLLPLLPIWVAFVALLGLGAASGVRTGELVALFVLTLGFTLLRPGATAGDRWSVAAGERHVVPLLAVGALLAVAVGAVLTLDDRADPRANEAAERTDSLIDPIEASIALRNLDPAVDLHTITLDGRPPEGPPRTWRSAALAQYDGQRWSPALTIRPAGTRVGPATGPTLQYRITFADDRVSLVPLPGSPVTVDAATESDPARTIVRLVTQPAPDEEIAVAANVDPPIAGADIMTRPLDETVSGLTQFAEQLGGAGTVTEQLDAIATTLRSEYVLDEDAPGGGLQQALVERFLRDTERGNRQQFVTGFALLARSLGVDARVATGFRTAAPGDESGTIVLSSADADVWPEVRTADGNWVTYDPVPAVEQRDDGPPPTVPRTQTPAAPQPPIPPPPDPSSEETPQVPPPVEVGDGLLSSIGVWSARVAIGAGLLLVPVLAVAMGVIVHKRRRRRRMLRSPDPITRIRGAWVLTVDALVDAGMRVQPSETDGEIAERSTGLSRGAARDVRHLATMSGHATFGSPSRPEAMADDAVACHDAIDRELRANRSWLQRLRWRLSVRSIRRSTRSPLRHAADPLPA